MPCFTNYITIRESGIPISGIYADDIKGVDSRFFDDLRDNDETTVDEWWAVFYENATQTFIAEIGKRLDNKFYREKNLSSGVTGEFLKTNTTGTGLAGIKIQTGLSRYSRISIPNLVVYSDINVLSPEASFYIYDAVGGNLLDTITQELTIGKNTVNVYKEYNEETLYIAFNRDQFQSRKTQGNFFRRYCGIEGADVFHVNGGGLLVNYNIKCSLRQWICDKLDLLKYAFKNWIGVELMMERIISNRSNRATIMSVERANELKNFYMTEFERQIDSDMDNINIKEDPWCYEVKPSYKDKTLLP